MSMPLARFANTLLIIAGHRVGNSERTMRATQTAPASVVNPVISCPTSGRCTTSGVMWRMTSALTQAQVPFGPRIASISGPDMALSSGGRASCAFVAPSRHLAWNSAGSLSTSLRSSGV